jgi:sugar (pentulose or hexulose) kinase
MEYAIAVIDIGMTNKKIAVYDEGLRQIDARYRNFPPRMVDGLETHDLEAMEEWFLEELGRIAREYPVKALAISTHGATFVCVGRDGKPSAPCVYYTHENGEDFHQRFYRQFGEPEALQERTGTPALKGMINAAKGIFFLKENYPQGFAQTASLLLYPQYWGFRFTGKTGAEGTYMGCHSYLWDQREHRLSSVAEGLGAAPLMPQTLGNSWDVLGTISAKTARRTGLSPGTIVTLGIHDSNSALLPHFAKRGKTGFILNSTGTWCVIMNPVKTYGFSPEELGKVVFFNISAFGEPIKTAIFLGGLEFEAWSGLLMKLHGQKELPPYDEGLYRTILREKNTFLLPELTPGSGQFPHSRPRVVEAGKDHPFDTIARSVSVARGVDAARGAIGGAALSAAPDADLPRSFRYYDRGIALLRISLVMQTLTALERTGASMENAGQASRGDLPQDIFTEGGFRKDLAYNTLLSSYLTNNRVFLTDIAEASALGAAMTAKMALTGKSQRDQSQRDQSQRDLSLGDLAGDFEIAYQEVPKAPIPELVSYREAWLQEAEKLTPPRP